MGDAESSQLKILLFPSPTKQTHFTDNPIWSDIGLAAQGTHRFRASPGEVMTVAMVGWRSSITASSWMLYLAAF
jgi:hypothetical protein